MPTLLQFKGFSFTNMQVSLSSSVMPMVKMVPRGFTAAADAYLTPGILRCGALHRQQACQ